MELVEKKIFNEFGDDSLEKRMILGGNSTGIMNLNASKYAWAPKLFKIMVNNFWLPEKVSLVDDRVTLKELTQDELESLKNTLSFLSALDSMQVNTLPHISNYVTAPEVSGLFVVQTYQELIHSQSYQYILQELFPSLERDEIYNYWRTNPLLLKRNKFIAEKYQLFVDKKTDENLKSALAADYALEGVYFYNGFQYFYQLAARNKIPNVAKIIKYIENDEQTHVSLYANVIRETFDMQLAKNQDILRNTLHEAAEQEIEWAKEIYGDRILGMSCESSENHVKFIVNQRCKLVGIPSIYPGVTKDPYMFLAGKKKENFFETKVVEYSQSAAVEGWDSF